MDYHQFMGNSFTTTQLGAAAVVLVVLVLVVVGAFVQRRRERTLAFRNRFGSEYDRAVLKHGSARDTEAKLGEREIRVEALKFRELGPTERERYVSEWHTVQSRFVDHPRMAVTADVSVNYPRVMENCRLAHSIAVRLGQAEASTEELRTAMIQYRHIFDDLLQTPKNLDTKTAA